MSICPGCWECQRRKKNSFSAWSHLYYSTRAGCRALFALLDSHDSSTNSPLACNCWWSPTLNMSAPARVLLAHKQARRPSASRPGGLFQFPLITEAVWLGLKRLNRLSEAGSCEVFGLCWCEKPIWLAVQGANLHMLLRALKRVGEDLKNPPNPFTALSGCINPTHWNSFWESYPHKSTLWSIKNYT